MDGFVQLTPTMFLIVCPFIFLAGFVDAVGGGGGLISLPAYMIAGLPVHTAIATNKLSSACGTSLATFRFIKKGLINFKLAVPSVITAILGSSLGAQLSMIVPETIMKYILMVILPVTAFFVLNKKLFHDNPEDFSITKSTFLIVMVAAFLIGVYDGFYGPGTGTFLIIAFTLFGKLPISRANGQAKVINLTTNITSLAIFLINGQVLLPLGLCAAAFNMLGGYIGAGIAIKKGSSIVKPIIILVLILLLLKILEVY